MGSGSPSEVARLVLDLALGRAPTLGTGRLVRIDGPAGSGKTTLAAAVAALAEQVGSVRVVHMDDLYDGWDGLPRVADQLGTLLEPLAGGSPGRYRRYDWHRGEYAETVRVEPVDLLVVEGVGSGAAAYDHLGTVLVWVEAPRDLRLARGRERDGEAMQAEWQRWVVAEAEHLERERTRARAEVVVDGTGVSPPGLG